MLVRDKQSERLTVAPLDAGWRQAWNFLWERIVIWVANKFSKKNLFTVDIANTGTDITLLPEFKQADVIHLHWINQGMLSLKNLRKIIDSGKPVVWTMHDMWAFTGICHYSRDCEHYKSHCHHCSYLNNGGGKKDLSYRTFKKKADLYKGAGIYFIACSHWLEEKAKESRVLTDCVVSSIPNPINTNLFKPRDKKAARTRFLLSEDKRWVLFGSLKITDKRKGIDCFVEACKILAEKYPEMKERLGVVAFGNQSELVRELIPFQVCAHNYISDEKELVNLYNAVDLFVIPSLEDNLPNTIMEAMACGVPCVGSDIGGIPQMIDHLHNGYVADYKSAEDLANGIYWTLTESEYTTLSEGARRKVLANYSEQIIAKQYITVYNQAIGKKG